MCRNVVGSFALFVSLGLVAGCGSSSRPAAPAATPPTPSLYTQTNASTGNSVLAYSRASTGALTVIGTYPTGGNGVGLPTSGLPFPIGGATGAVQLSSDGTHLYAVDAGSADVAAFTVALNGSLTLINRYPTGGTSPGSITINSAGTYLYVLNTGSVPTGNNVPGGITGFTVAADGSLTALANSTQPLSANQYLDPSEVAFSPDGTYLAATEKGSSVIDIFPLTAGVAGKAVASPSVGKIPFGFAFTPSGALIVANVESTADLTASTLSSYTASAAGTLTSVSGQVHDNQGAACWVALTSDGTYAYTTNTLSGSISGYSVGTGGSLTLLTPTGITAPQANTTGPIDDVVTPTTVSTTTTATATPSYLYVLDSFAGASPGSIVGFSIGTGGTLTAIPTTVTGLLPGSIGLAVR